MKRYGYYIINISLDVAWNKTLAFFKNHRGSFKIKDQYISANTLYRKVRIRHGFSTHVYGSSFGETYDLIFGHDPSDSTTHISISVKYSNFGKGFPSKVPKDMMKKWAHELGITPMKLIKEIDHDFLANLDKIQEIPEQQTQHLLKVFCSDCGESNRKGDNFCVSCGISL